MGKQPAYKHRKEKMPELALSQLEKLYALFSSKGWPIDESLEVSEFERYCAMLSNMDNSHQDFMIGLSQNFEHITVKDYLHNLLKPLRKLREDAGKDNLVFVTCTPKKDVGCVKSSAAVLYQIKGTTIRQYINLHPYYVADNIKTAFSDNMQNCRVVLVDDFVGTGETAMGAVDFVHELCPGLTDNSKIVVLCIIAMKDGVELLKSKGISTYCHHIRQKGISEELGEQERIAALKNMTEIEANLKRLKGDCRFGYKKSEALICMERCPNNTFPIYWLGNRAPYER